MSYATRYGHEPREQERHDRECDGDAKGTGLDSPILPPAIEIAGILERAEDNGR